MKTHAQLYTYSNLGVVLLCKGKDANVMMPPDAIALTIVKFKRKIA